MGILEKFKILIFFIIVTALVSIISFFLGMTDFALALMFSGTVLISMILFFI